MQTKQLLSCSLALFLAACSSSGNDSVVVGDVNDSSAASVNNTATDDVTADEVVESTEPLAVSDNTTPVAPVAPVTPDEPVPAPAPVAADFRIADSAFELIHDLAGYKPDQLAGVVADLATLTANNAIGSEAVTGGEFSTFDTNVGDTITPTTRTLYQCSGGGTLTLETGTLSIGFIDYSHTREVNQYDFDQCQFEVTNNRVATGNYSANGTLRTSASSISGSGFGESTGATEWTAFDLVGTEELRYELQGTSTWESESSVGFSGGSRQTAFDYYRKTQSGNLSEQMLDSAFQMELAFDGGNVNNTMNLELSGGFEDERNAGLATIISTIQPLLFSAGFEEDESLLIHAGELSVGASNGAMMTLTAVASGDRSDPSVEPLVDWSSVSSNGQVDSAERATIGSYSAAGAVCLADISVRPILCDDGSFRYVLP